MIDNHLHFGNRLKIDPASIQWRRVLDVSDRVLRHVTVGLGSEKDGPQRDTGFAITVASEVMAILGLATGLVQNGEGGPVLVHTGPFGNIAHGNSSIVADQIALRLADYVITESGFAADLGAEKHQVSATSRRPARFRYLYDLDMPIADKIETVATRIYGADGVDYSDTARRQMEKYALHGFDGLPVCIPKTHLSLSDNPALKGRPSGFRLNVRDIRLAAGAGFLVPLCGDISRMPGLPRFPAATRIDLDRDGRVVGLF